MTQKGYEFSTKAKSEIPHMEVEGLDHPLRVMTREHIRERDNLNVGNTATAIRRRVISQQNGKREFDEGKEDFLSWRGADA